MTPEKKVENQIKNYLDSIGAWYLKVHGNAFQPAGTPDILACVNGRFVAIEVKRPTGGRVTALQKAKLNLINNAGGIAFAANNVEVVREELMEHRII